MQRIRLVFPQEFKTIDLRLLKCLEGLFLAGQINGTIGYEEAAAQGCNGLESTPP